MTTTEAVVFDRVTKRYGDVRAVDDVTLTLRAGETVALGMAVADAGRALEDGAGGQVQWSGPGSWRRCGGGRPGRWAGGADVS